MDSASRPYRSKTVKPCDACRKRRTACIRNEGDPDCALCRHRKTKCTFETTPKVRKGAKRRLRGQYEEQGCTTMAAQAPLAGREDPGESGNVPPTMALSDLPFTPTVVDDIDWESWMRIDPRYLITEKHLNTQSKEWFSSSTSTKDRTYLYAGLSSDQGPYLLRHLIFDQSGCFGDERWLVWRVAAQTDAAYLTVFPNHHLDVHAGMYETDNIEALFSPFQGELIELFFTYVHPTYPILGSMSSFQKQRHDGCVPASLLAVILLHGTNFWHASSHRDTPLPDQRALQPYIYSCIAFEAKTPNLAVIQTALLYIQLPARFHRAPNHPGIWPLSLMIVGIAQDIGLHMDPAKWSLIPEERKLRRIVWWAVFIHEKNMAHWLGRPSHIKACDFNVDPPTLKDFADQDGKVEVESIPWATSFIAMANLSLVVSDLLEEFYTVRSNFQSMEGEVAMRKACSLLTILKAWQRKHGVEPVSATEPHSYTVLLLSVWVELSARRAALGSRISPNPESDELSDNTLQTVTQTLLPALDAILQSPLIGFWLNYNKGILCMTGSFLISLMLSSTNDAMLEQRRGTLFDFRSRLQMLVSRGFEFAKLPLRRINLILEELFVGNTASESEKGTWRASFPDDDADESLWASYRIAFP